MTAMIAIALIAAAILGLVCVHCWLAKQKAGCRDKLKAVANRNAGVW